MWLKAQTCETRSMDLPRANIVNAIILTKSTIPPWAINKSGPAHPHWLQWPTLSAVSITSGYVVHTMDCFLKCSENKLKYKFPASTNRKVVHIWKSSALCWRNLCFLCISFPPNQNHLMRHEPAPPPTWLSLVPRWLKLPISQRGGRGVLGKTKSTH